MKDETNTHYGVRGKVRVVHEIDAETRNEEPLILSVTGRFDHPRLAQVVSFLGVTRAF